jgi:hypothetical protein
LLHHRRLVETLAGVTKDVLSVVEFGSLEPLRPRHLVAVEHPLVRPGSLHLVVFPDADPELFEFVYRPLPQLPVVVEGEAFLTLQPLHIAGDVRVLLELF